MYFDDLDLPELDLPIVWMEFEDGPSIDELLRTAPAVLSPPPKAGQTAFSERICIRINSGILAELKKRAAEQGVRYQTFINQILAQHAAM